MTRHRIDESTLQCGVTWLAERDNDLAAVVDKHGLPPLWLRPPGFETLVRIVLEQQVSQASGRALYHRIRDHVGCVTVETIGRLGEAGLHSLGVTRQKASYCLGVVERIRSGSLDLEQLETANDRGARDALLAVRGIGPWTADVYLLMALARPDVWPDGDVALLTALRHARSLPDRPTVAEAARYADRWSPWRSVAARLLWHGYIEGSLRNSA